MLDVAIVGGGPGGLYAALQLASRGRRVVVFEEHPSAGEPVHCTGVLAVETFDEFDVPRTAILNPLGTARFFGPSGASIEYSTPGTEAVVIDRRVFDRALCERAAAAGAEIRVGTKVSDVRVDARCATITTSDTVVQARAAILACGANYVFQRRLGLGTPALHLQSAQIEVPARAAREVEVHFGGDVAPKGFAWVVPVRRGAETFARVGLMCDRDARDYFDRFLARIGPRWQTRTSDCLEGRPSPRSKILPLGPIDRTYAARLLAVGDAAGLVKATTGGGIYYSLVSGALAAETLQDALEHDDLRAPALARYERRWKEQLGEELSAQMKLREVAHRLTDEDIDSLFELARTDGVMPIVRRTAKFNRHRDLIVSLMGHPPARRVLMRRVLGRTGRDVRVQAQGAGLRAKG